MSRAGCPYDNAPMKRYLNMLNNEWTNLFSYRSLQMLDDAVDDFAYTWYNHVGPHSYNNSLAPSLARSA